MGYTSFEHALDPNIVPYKHKNISCGTKDFVETHLASISAYVMLRSRVLAVFYYLVMKNTSPTKRAVTTAPQCEDYEPKPKRCGALFVVRCRTSSAYDEHYLG